MGVEQLFELSLGDVQLRGHEALMSNLGVGHLAVYSLAKPSHVVDVGSKGVNVLFGVAGYGDVLAPPPPRRWPRTSRSGSIITMLTGWRFASRIGPL